MGKICNVKTESSKYSCWEEQTSFIHSLNHLLNIYGVFTIVYALR